MLFASKQFEEKINGQKERPSTLSTINHFTQMLRVLNQRLQDPSQAISDSTIAAVAGLALLEAGAPAVSFETH
jgi:hypothetical protein